MKLLIAIFTTFISYGLFANGVSVKGVDLRSRGAEAKLSIKHEGMLEENPRVEIEDKALKVFIPHSGLVKKINKKIDGVALSASMTEGETVVLTASLPYSLKGRESEIAIALREGGFDVNFPRVEVLKKTAGLSRAPAIIGHPMASDKNEADKLDEEYLKSLEKNQEILQAKVDRQEDKSIKEELAKKTEVQTVSTVQSSRAATPVKNAETGEVKPQFGMAGHIGKFVAFLSLMIAGIYGLLALFKKGVIKKGKLGFLHSTKMVEVLSTTYVAPKRSLMMVKAHKQIFLISNTEGGIQFLSEIKDVVGLIKTGEEELTGSNFDTNLYSADKEEKQFKLKEESVAAYQDDYVMESVEDMGNDRVPERSATHAARAIEKKPIKDQVRFSEQIKTKVKNLKQL